MTRCLWILMLCLAAATSCSGGGRDNSVPSDSMERHRSLTESLPDEKSQYLKYCVAADNARFFEAQGARYELGLNLEALGDVMAQLGDNRLAADYYHRAAGCFASSGSTDDLYRLRLHITNVLPPDERVTAIEAILADTATHHLPAIRAMALKGAYMATDSAAYLDSCLAVIARHPGTCRADLPALLAMRAQESLLADDLEEAIAAIPRIRAEEDAARPIAQHRELIHTLLAQIYHAAGRDDSCVQELLDVVWWTDSAYREANLPAIYAQETRRMIDLAENNAELRQRTARLWWALGALLLIAILAGVIIYARHRQAQARRAVESLYGKLALLQRARAVQDAVIDENRQLLSDIRQALSRHADTRASLPLADDIRRAISVYSIHDADREGLLEVSERLDPQFATRLKADFPKLSEGQLRFASLIAAGVDNHRLASILNISSRSLYTARYRLRTALGLSKTDSLEDFLRQYSPAGRGDDGGGPRHCR